MTQLCRIGALVAVAACLNTMTATPTSARPTPVERHGRLGVKGNRVVDQHGRPVQLRGMSLFWSQWKPEYYNAECVRWLRDDWNCTVVRAAMAVHHDGYVDHPQREMRKVETVIEAAIDLGIYVIVDWHAHEPEPERAGEFFAQLARRYGRHPNVIYETWNEPLKDHDWSTVIRPYHERVVARIREHDPDNLVVCGTQTWSQDVDKAAADPVRGHENVAYTLHFYAATHKQWLRDRATGAMDKGIALFVTEWGTSEANGSGTLDDVETRRWLDFMDEHRLSWCNWSVTDKQETSAALRPGATATGGWAEAMISPSGRLVRAELRAKAAPSRPATTQSSEPGRD